jgi:hypothetical protein
VIRKRDWLWLFAFPLYLLISTFRHESAHAVVAYLQGVDIQKLVFWPSFYNGKFYFGYVLWQGEITWLALAAPYLFDIITYSFVFPLVFVKTFRRHWLWLNLVIIGLISPLVNSGYNYLRGSDVRRLHEKLPNLLVHGCFLLGLGLGLFGLVLVFTQSKQAIKGQSHLP